MKIITVILFAKEPFEPSDSKRKVGTPDEYLKWKFGKVKGKKGLYSEYKAVSTKNTLVIIVDLEISVFETFM